MSLNNISTIWLLNCVEWCVWGGVQDGSHPMTWLTYEASQDAFPTCPSSALVSLGFLFWEPLWGKQKRLGTFRAFVYSQVEDEGYLLRTPNPSKRFSGGGKFLSKDKSDFFKILFSTNPAKMYMYVLVSGCWKRMEFSSFPLFSHPKCLWLPRFPREANIIRSLLEVKYRLSEGCGWPRTMITLNNIITGWGKVQPGPELA